MALPEVGLKAVIDNLSGFNAGAKAVQGAYDGINTKTDTVTKATEKMGLKFDEVAQRWRVGGGRFASAAELMAASVQNPKKALDELGKKATETGHKAAVASFDFDKLAKSAKAIGGDFANLGNSLLSVGANAAGVALRGITALAAGIATFAVSGIMQAKDLDQQMANIAATMGKTKEAVGPLKDLILDLSLNPNLTVNATQAAEAIELLAANGLNMTQILGGAAESTVAMANATGADFGTAANIATGAMQAFNLEAEDLTLVADGITGVLVSSKFSAEDYAGALAQAGAIAGSTGVSLQDFNAVIGGTASSFASGSDAGTSFKTFLQRMANPTDEAKALMQQLGISVFDSSGNMKDMSQIVGQLNKSFGGMTEEQKASTAAILGGADASRTLLALAGMTSEEFNALSAQINASGQATQAAATRVDSLSGAWEILNGIIQGIQIQVGDLFLPTLRQVTSVLSDLASANAPMIVGFFDALIGKGQELFAAFSKFGAGGLFAALGFEGAALFFKKLSELFVLIIGDTGTLATTLQTTLGSAFSFLATNVFPILTEAIKFIIANFNEFKGAIIGIGVVMGGAIFAALIAALFSLLTPINLIIAGAALLGAAWAGNWGNIQGITASAWAVLQPILIQLMTWLQTNIPAAITTMATIWTTTLLPSITAVAEFISGTMFPLWMQLHGVLLAVGDVISAVLNVAITASAGAWQNVLLPAIMAVAEFLEPVLMPAITAIGTYLSTTLNPMLNSTGGAFGFISETLTKATTLFTGWADAVRAFQLPPPLVSNSPTPLEMGLQGIAGVLSGPLQNAFSVFGRIAQTPLKIVAALSGQIVANFRELLALISIIVETWQPTTEAMITQFKNLSSAAVTSTAQIKAAFLTIGPALTSTNSVALTLSTSIRSIGTSAASSAASLKSMSIIDFSNLGEGINDVSEQVDDARSAFSTARSAASSFNSTSLSAMKSALSNVNSELENIIENFATAADAAGNSGLGGFSSSARVAGGMVSGASSGARNTTIINNFANNFGGNNISSGIDESQFDAMVLASLQRLSR